MDTMNGTMTLDEMRSAATRLSGELRSADAQGAAAATGGSKHRGLPEDVRGRFLALRASLYQRGIYDPVLVRFDTATTAQATNGEVADQLDAVAESLK